MVSRPLSCTVSAKELPLAKMLALAKNVGISLLASIECDRRILVEKIDTASGV